MFEKIKSFIPLLVILLLTGFSMHAQQADNFTVTDYNGQVHRLYQDYLNQGKSVVIKIFFVNCPPCIAISPSFQQLYEEWGEGNNDVQFIELSNKSFDSNADVQSYSNGLGLSFPGVGEDGGALTALQPYLNGTYGPFFGTPTFIVISPDGSVNYDVRGAGNINTITALDMAITATGAEKPNSTVLPTTFNVNIRDAFDQDVQGVDFFLGSANSSVEYPIDLSNSSFQVTDFMQEYPDIINPVIRARKTDNVFSNLSASDIIIILKHILLLDIIVDPSLVLAADTNGDGSVSASDLITLQKIILRIDNNFPNQDPYRIFPEEIPVSANPGELETINFVAIKTGDLNGF